MDAVIIPVPAAIFPAGRVELAYENRLCRCDRQTIHALDYFAQCALLGKANLTELLFARLFIGSALQLLGARLVDDVGHLLCPDSRTRRGRDLRHCYESRSSYAWKSARIAAVFCVSVQKRKRLNQPQPG